MSVSGKIDFPEYMKIVHADWVAHTDVAGASPDTITSSVTDIINTALGTNPFASMSAHDPSTELTGMATAVSDYNTLIAALDPATDWAANIATAVANTEGADEFETEIQDQIETNVLPQFNAGMRNIGAIHSSAYVLGEAMIYAQKVKEKAKFQLGITTQGITTMLELAKMKLSLQKNYVATVLDQLRLRIVAEKEENDTANSLDEADAKWDLSVYQTGANVMACISGAPSTTSMPASAGGSNTRSAIGGALSGAALGAAIGGQFGQSGWGGAIGGAAGLAASFM